MLSSAGMRQPADRREKVLYQQRSRQDAAEETVAGRLFALADRTLLRGPEGRGRAESLGRTKLDGFATTPDTDFGQLPVPRDRLSKAEGEKTRRSPSAKSIEPRAPSSSPGGLIRPRRSSCSNVQPRPYNITNAATPKRGRATPRRRNENC